MSMNAPRLINPEGRLLPEFESQLRLVRKSKSLWAKCLESSTVIETLEGPVPAATGDYVCRGIHGELWPQSAKKLIETFVATELFDSDGWQQFDPKPNVAPVQATQISFPFSVTAQWGTLVGKANDYFARSTADPSDCWIVDRSIFEASYEGCDPLIY